MFKKVMKTIGSLILALTMLFSLSTSVLAYTPIDTSKKGSITVTPQGGKSIGTKLTLYKVADVVVENANQKYVLTDDFADCDVNLENLDDIKTLASTFKKQVTSEKLESLSEKEVSEDGSVTFDNLSLGLYLILQSHIEQGKDAINPFIVSVPLQNDDESWSYDVVASPKATEYELMSLTVKKVWNDGKNSSRPSSVSVSLYSGDKVVKTATLSDSNNWTCTWDDLEESDSYKVEEAAVANYVATYSQSGDTWTITNTAKLAQTGQLNWPIPVLAGCGVALFALGWVLVNAKKKA